MKLVSRTKWIVVVILVLTIQTPSKANSIRGVEKTTSALKHFFQRRKLANELTAEQSEDCFNALASNDENEDNFIDRPEYVRVVKDLSSDQIDYGSFQQLPPILRSNFIQVFLQSSGSARGLAWNVYGSKLQEDASSSQLSFLEMACQETFLAIEYVLQEQSPSSPTTSPTTNTPTLEPSTLSPTNAPTITTSTPSLSSSPTTFPITNTPTLEPSTLSPTNAPTITTSTPSLSPSNIPTESLSAGPTLEPSTLPSTSPSSPSTLPSTSPSSPSQSPSPSITSAPTTALVQSLDENATLEMLECYYALSLSDKDRDDWMNQTEYVSFLHLLSNTIDRETPFEDLPLLLQVNFKFFVRHNATDNSTMMDTNMSNNLFVHSENDRVWIYGARYPQQNATEEQYQQLQLLCTQTNLVLDSFIEQSSPTMAPTQTISLRVVSEFVISNQIGLTAANMTTDDLQEAYDMTAAQVVEKESASSSRRRRGLLEGVGYMEDSGRIDTVNDTSCPSPDDTKWCQNVSAFFLLSLDDESIATDEVKDTYTLAMDTAIQNGDLQQNLLSINPDSPIVVVVEDGEEEYGDDNVYRGGFEEGNEDDEKTFWLVLGIVCCGQVVFVGIAVFICLRREEMDLDKKEQEEDYKLSLLQKQTMPEKLPQEMTVRVPSQQQENDKEEKVPEPHFQSHNTKEEINGSWEKQDKQVTQVRAPPLDPLKNYLSYENVSFDELPPPGVLDMSTSSSNLSPLGTTGDEDEDGLAR